MYYCQACKRGERFWPRQKRRSSCSIVSVSTLYMVATPIGNLGDITLRALETLKSVDTVACEDTRHTLKLLSHFDIHKPLISCHANDERRGAERVVSLLDEGKDVAYCSMLELRGCRTPAPWWCVRRAGVDTRSFLYRPQRICLPCQRCRRFGADLSVRWISLSQARKRKTRLKELLLRGESLCCMNLLSGSASS